jgi:hypothetical protein
MRQSFSEIFTESDDTLSQILTCAFRISAKGVLSVVPPIAKLAIKVKSSITFMKVIFNNLPK